jgi:hypothetical protein
MPAPQTAEDYFSDRQKYSPIAARCQIGLSDVNLLVPERVLIQLGARFAE